MGRGFSGLVLSLLLAGVLLAAVELRFANAYVDVYIRADGSIDPPSAPITTTDNITYTFAGNITGSVSVQRNDTIINGNGYTLELDYSYVSGYVLNCVQNVTIENTTINSSGSKDVLSGIEVYRSSGCTITRNVILGHSYYCAGIYVSSSSNNTVSSNSLNLRTSFHPPPPYPSAILVYNRSNYNTIYMNKVTCIADWGSGIAVVGGSSNNNVSRNLVTNNLACYGIFLSKARNSILTENNITGNRFNFDVDGESISDFVNYVDTSNLVDGRPVYYWINKHDMAVPPDAGAVILVNCTRITVEGLDLANNGEGVLLAYTTDTVIKRNNISFSHYGVFLKCSTGNLLYGNNITWNDHSHRLLESPGNRAYHNLFDAGAYYGDEQPDMHPDTLPIVPPLYDPWCLGGNYWSWYTGQDHFSGDNQDQIGNDGIGDTPMETPGRVIDTEPLVNPWTPHNVAAINVRPFKSAVTYSALLQIDALIINRGDYAETFNVTLYANSTAIDRKQMTLDREGYAYAIFTWNTTGFTEYGNYTLYSSALNNDNVGGTVVLVHQGDINGDGKVDIKDLAEMSAAFGSYRVNDYLSPWYSHYVHQYFCPTCTHTPNADVNNDNKVDIQDLSRTSGSFGWHR